VWLWLYAFMFHLRYALRTLVASGFLQCFLPRKSCLSLPTFCDGYHSAVVSGVVPSSWILYGGDITVTMVATALGVLPSSISRLTVNAQRSLAQLGTVFFYMHTSLWCP
jgi:hypothetical protein